MVLEKQRRSVLAAFVVSIEGVAVDVFKGCSMQENGCSQILVYLRYIPIFPKILLR